MKRILQSADYLYNKIRITAKINDLAIIKAGIDVNDTPYVQLGSKIFFYGLQTSDKDLKYYRLLSKKTKDILPFSCFKVAQDIVIRYYEGGLRLGGPKKEEYYQARQADVVAEMGAYQGFYTMFLAEKVGRYGTVVAIEPFEENLSLLRKNITHNELSNVVIVNRGVWKERTELTFFRKKEDMQSGSIKLSNENRNRIIIPVDRLDNILAENNINEVNFMIIQLNGAEKEALLGLTKYKPLNIAIAARYKDKREPAVSSVAAILKDRNYRVRILKRHYIYAELISQ
jgi:FkbM family methyltransferase